MTITKSGELASFYTVNKAPIKHLRVYFSPKQAGEGTPSPENVREISGWSGLNTWHTNNNLLPLSDYSYRESGIAVSRISKKISITGTSDGAFYRGVTGSWTADGSSVVLYNVPILTNGATWYVWNGTGNIISGRNINGISFRPANGVKVSLCLAVDYANITMNAEFTPIMCKTSDLSTIPIDWTSEVGTVYGGYVDLVTGELVETFVVEEPNEMPFTIEPGYACQWLHSKCNTGGIQNYNNGMSSHWKITQYDHSNFVYLNQNGALVIGKQFFDSVGIEYTSESIMAYIAEQKQNGTPLQIGAPLITPITHQLTPTQLSTLIGRNNIWSNADRVEVEYDLAESNDELYRHRNILMRSAPHIETASGNMAHFETDIAAPIKSAKINFNPVQEGSGDQSPTNVRPINGFTNLSLYHSGENLYVPNSNNKGYISKSGVITVDETSTYTDLIPVNLGEIYSFECTTVSVNGDTNRRIHGYNSSGTWVQQLASGTTAANTVEDRKISATIPAGISYIRVSFRNQDTDVRIVKENIIEANWQTAAGTIYGGYIDLITGKVWKTWDIFMPNENDYMFKYSNNDFMQIRLAGGDAPRIKTRNSAYCSHYKMEMNPNIYGLTGVDYVNTTCQLIVQNGENGYFDTLEEFRAWLVEQRENGTPFYIVYEKDVPELVATITPFAFNSLRGTNNIWTDSNGPVEIKYWTH